MTEQTPQPSMDIQDPLPEANWLWRRVFCFLVVSVLLYFTWVGVDRLGKVAVVMPAKGIPALVSVTKSILFFALVITTYYLLAPSAEQLTKLVKTASLLKSGVQVAARRTIREVGRTTEEAATIAQPPQPVIPGRGAPDWPPEDTDSRIPEPMPDAPLPGTVEHTPEEAPWAEKNQ